MPKKSASPRQFDDHRFRALIEHSHEAVVLLDQRGIIAYASHTTDPILGFDPAFCEGRSIFDFIAPVDKSTAEKTFQQIIATPNKPFIIQICGQHKDGSIRWLECTATNYLNDHDIQAVIVNAHDITHLKQVETRLKTCDELYRIIVDTAGDLVLVLDITGSVQFVSPSFDKVLGYSQAALLGKPIFEIVHPEDRIIVQKEMQSALQGGIGRGIIRLMHKNGTYRTFEGSGKAIFENRQAIQLAASLHDITAQSELEERKNDFISIASHEMKTPVTTLKVYTQILEKRFKENRDNAIRSYLDKMDQQIDRLTELISELLDLSRIQSGKLNLNLAMNDINKIVRDTVESIQTANPQFKITIEGKSKSKVWCDDNRVEQVIVNLLTNAIKYSETANEIKVHIKQAGEIAQVSVQDFGIGIEKQHQHRIFERFYQVGDVSTNTFPGLGIGLYICHKIIHRHGGTLTVKSQPDQGSTFSFTLRTKPATEVE